MTYTTAGDGTVPLVSAETASADVIYYTDLRKLKTEHSGMIGAPVVIGKIYDLLRRSEKNSPNFSTARPADRDFTETSEVGK